MNSGDPAARTARAEQLLELGRAAEARSQIAMVLAAEPGNGRAQRLLVRCLLKLGDPQSLGAARRAVTLEPDNEHSQRLASLACAKAGLSEEAVRHAREAVRLAPAEWRARHVLTSALVETDPEAAFAAGTEGLRVGPHEPSMHLVVGLAALKARRNARAREAFRTVLSLDPGNAMARNNLAVLDLRANKFGDAMEGFGSALAADPRLDLARGNIDTVALNMLIKLRAVVLIGILIAFQVLLNRPTGPDAATVDVVAAAALLTMWAVTAGWGYSRIPRRFRRYALGVVRRRGRAAVIATAIAAAVIGVVIGPLLHLVSSSAGITLGSGVAVAITAAELIWYSKRRVRVIGTVPGLIGGPGRWRHWRRRSRRC
jgi:tetratricopeptide (TPR) repeat protein